MGAEIGQWREWNDEGSLDWHLLDEPDHAGVRALVRELNRTLRERTALFESDSDPAGFEWLDVENALENVVAFARLTPSTGECVVCVGNFSPLARGGYRLPLPRPGRYRLLLNTDAAHFGGTGSALFETFDAAAEHWRGRQYSALIDLPPLSTLWYAAPPPPAADVQT
jgi:1,4-alpha-glucan branching enzyme